MSEFPTAELANDTLMTGMEYHLPIDLVRDFQQKGFVTLPRVQDDVAFQNLYDAFDAVVGLVEEGLPQGWQCLDDVIGDFISNRADPVVTDSARISKIKNPFRNYHIRSYQYFSGLLEFCSDRTVVPSPVQCFWSAMNSMLSICNEKIAPCLVGVNWQPRFTTLLKVWKYTPVNENRFLIPIHYDRSVFSTVVHTRNPKAERLVVGGPGTGTQIEELAKDFYSMALYRPRHVDFPLVFPGMHARSYYGLLPTPHAVEQIEPDIQGQSRYSLVYFIVPRGGVTVQQNYVAHE